MLDAERAEVAAAARRLAGDGLMIGTAGNLSMRDGERVAITPTGAALAKLRAEDVTVIDLEGGLLDGRLAPTSELDLHLGVYRRYDAGAVVHTHSPAATALSCVVEEVPCVHYAMLALGGDVRVARYETFGTPQLAESVLTALEGRTAALMANHGTLTFGADMEGAVEATLLLEWSCDVYSRALAAGRPRVLTDREREDVVRAALSRGYGNTREVGGAETTGSKRESEEGHS